MTIIMIIMVMMVVMVMWNTMVEDHPGRRSYWWWSCPRRCRCPGWWQQRWSSVCLLTMTRRMKIPGARLAKVIHSKADSRPKDRDSNLNQWWSWWRWNQTKEIRENVSTNPVDELLWKFLCSAGYREIATGQSKLILNPTLPVKLEENIGINIFWSKYVLISIFQ